ncbi:13781_t:CDS:2, partial [Funneliformis geosporum]
TEHAEQVNEQPAQESRVENLRDESHVNSTEQREPVTNNETTGPVSVLRRRSVVENNTTANLISNNDQRRNDRVLQESNRRINQLIVIQIESNEASVSAPKHNGNKRKADTENENPNAKRLKGKNKSMIASRTKKTSQERRLSRIINICPKKFRKRIYRATSERMYLICRDKIKDLHHKYAIMGTTGNVYTVNITHLPKCTCLDFSTHKFCKHIVFVYLKVLCINRDSNYIFQRALLSSELKSMFSDKRPDRSVYSSLAVRKRYRAYILGTASQTRKPIEGNCSVCYESLDENEIDNIVWCQKGCGNNLHEACYEKWKESRLEFKGRNVTCIYCRCVWLEDKTKFSISKEGFVNFGIMGERNKKF